MHETEKFRNWTKAHLRSEIRSLKSDCLAARFESNSRFWISDLRWAFVQFQNSFNLLYILASIFTDICENRNQ
jgi:hypothetical protein